jgi:uncharacterized protein (TIGR00255 family)
LKFQTVFISYSFNDKIFARAVNNCLKRKGVITFLWEQDAPGGKKLHSIMRERIKNHIAEYNLGEQVDQNRFEQELIYYIEKIDLTEEQVRLKNHCEYFKAILQEDGEGKGKKLSFVLQEIGREINTTGAKAYDSSIQKCVVLMKDELEKAKEQILNVL